MQAIVSGQPNVGAQKVRTDESQQLPGLRKRRRGRDQVPFGREQRAETAQRGDVGVDEDIMAATVPTAPP